MQQPRGAGKRQKTPQPRQCGSPERLLHSGLLRAAPPNPLGNRHDLDCVRHDVAIRTGRAQHQRVGGALGEFKHPQNAGPLGCGFPLVQVNV